MKMSNNVYNFIKWVVITVVPAFIAANTGLSALYNYDPTVINGTVSVVATAVGALIGYSSVQYNKEQQNESEKTHE